MGDADGGTLGDVVEDDRTIGSEEAVYIESLKQDLEGVLSGLSARDAGVLRMRFGLTDGREYTLDEVGAEFHVTRERIRQIEAKAIRQLRAHHISPGSVMADYQLGPMADKQLASRTSSGTKKQK
jgi:RNA polymerase primary sigma factor